MLLIGSYAINIHIPGFRAKPCDVDVIATPADVDRLVADGFVLRERPTPELSLISPSGTIWDVELRTGLTMQLSHVDTVMLEGQMLDVPNRDELYTLKVSHRYRKNSPHFMKTMLDIYAMRWAGARIHNTSWLAQREKETYWYAHPSLMKDKTGFFSGDGVSYVYEHDALHQAVKLGDAPAYTRFSTPGHEVHSSRTKFEQLPELYKLHAVLEEAYVLALERSQIPHPGVTPEKSFRIALEKICTSITSGWFREYAWENFFAVLAMYSPAYVDRFNEWKATQHAVA